MPMETIFIFANNIYYFKNQTSYEMGQ